MRNFAGWCLAGAVALALSACTGTQNEGNGGVHMGANSSQEVKRTTESQHAQGIEPPANRPTRQQPQTASPSNAAAQNAGQASSEKKPQHLIGGQTTETNAPGQAAAGAGTSGGTPGGR